MGLPRTAAFMEARLPWASLALERGRRELRLPAGDGQEVQPVAVVRVQDALDRGVARVGDRPGRQARVQVRVVRPGRLGLLDRGADRVLAEAVEHRAVELQVHADGDPVVDHLGDLRVVADRAAFGLGQGRLGDQLGRGEAGRLGRGLDVDRLRLDVEPLDHRLQDLQRGLVGHDRVGGGEQVAFRLAAGVGRQAELRRVGQDLLEVLERDLGLLRDDRDDVDGPLALGDRHRGLIQVLGVEQRGVGEARLHVVVQQVEAGHQAGRAGARGGVLGRVGERALAGDHAELQQPRGEAERGVAAHHLHGHFAGALAYVVRRMVPGVVLVLDVKPADEAADHDRGDDREHQDPGQPAGRLLAGPGASGVPVIAVIPVAAAVPAAGAAGAAVGLAAAARAAAVVIACAVAVVVPAVALLGAAVVVAAAAAEAGHERAVALLLLPVAVAALVVAAGRAARAGAGLAGLAAGAVPGGLWSALRVPVPAVRSVRLAVAPGVIAGFGVVPVVAVIVVGLAVVRPAIEVLATVARSLVAPAGAAPPTGPGALGIAFVVGRAVTLPGVTARAVAAAHWPDPRTTSWPGAAPVRRSASSAASSSTAAAAESTVCRRLRESCPPARSASCAVDVVKRSSMSRTGSGATLAARSAATFLAETAAGPSRPDRDRGRPTKISIASSVAASEARASKSPLPRRTTVSGVASTPRESLRATPIRTVPGSTARRTPDLTG